MRHGNLIATALLACCLTAPAGAQNGAVYTPAAVMPSMHDLVDMHAAMTAVVTAQQAAEFSDRLKAALPAMIGNRQRLAAAAEAAKTGTRTAEAAQADALWQEALAKRPALETEMARLEKLNVGLADLFAKVRTLMQ